MSESKKLNSIFLGQFKLTDSFDLDLKVVEEYVWDSARRQGEFLNLRIDRLEIELSETKDQNVKIYSVKVFGEDLN